MGLQCMAIPCSTLYCTRWLYTRRVLTLFLVLFINPSPSTRVPSYIAIRVLYTGFITGEGVDIGWGEPERALTNVPASPLYKTLAMQELHKCFSSPPHVCFYALLWCS